MNENELTKLLNEDSLQKLDVIKKMLSNYGLKLKIIPDNHENNLNVFRLAVTDNKNNVSICYDKEFGLFNSELQDDLSTEFAVAFCELFDAAELMRFVIKVLSSVNKVKHVQFTKVMLSSEISSQICVTVDITDENHNKIGSGEFVVDPENRGVDMQLYISGLEVTTCSLYLNGIHKDVNVEIFPQGEIINFNDYLPNEFKFDIDIRVKKYFDSFDTENLRKARKIIKNVIDVYKMIKEN